MFGPEVSAIATYCVVSATITAAICCYAKVIGTTFGLVDRPDGIRKLHKGETPLVGGLAILVPSLLVSIVYMTAWSEHSYMSVAILATSCMLIVGLVDDRIELSALRRLIFMIAIVLSVFAIEPLFVLNVFRFEMFGYSMAVDLGPFAAPVTALIILGFINASNMADGISGQLLGSVMIWCVLLSLHIGPGANLPFLALTCSAGVTIVFNLRGRLFSGSSGAYAASLFIALGTIAAYRRSYGAMPAELPLYWFWLPTLDCVRLMVSRMLAHKSPFSGDRDHLHHVLGEYMNKNAVLPVYLAMLAAPGVAAEINGTLASIVLLLGVVGYTALITLRPSARKVPAPVAVSFDRPVSLLPQSALRSSPVSAVDIAAE